MDDRNGTPDGPDDTDRRLAGLRGMVIALAGGLTVVAGILIFSGTRLNGPIAPDPMIAYVFFGIGMGVLVGGQIAAPFVRAPLVARAAAANTERERFAAFSGWTILRAALLEGPGLLFVVGFFVTQNWLVVAPVPVLLALLLTLAPTRAKYDDWADAVSRAAGSGQP